MSLNHVTLDDKYDLTRSRVFVTGYQALVRLTMMQHERDKRAGLNTAGYVTGYRGSPLGGLDYQFQRAASHLAPRNTLFQTAINEDLAATALWGSQQAELRGEGKFDGVFGMWYGKGPGVDRSGDAFRHANFAGTSKFGGVLALMGDDHTAESSTTAHQSEFNFVDVMIPILNPAGVQEIVDYGLYGWAMSRFTGTWVGLKCMHETVEATAVIDGALDRLHIVIPGPDEFQTPEGGLNIRLNDTVLGMEARLHDYKRDAMLAFVRANKLNQVITSGGRNPKIGVITTGKSYLDVRQALDELGIDEVKANDWGLRIDKIACPWPIGKPELMEFARGLDLIIVVEEKRSLIEVQVREELYGTANQPIVIGKKDEQGNWLFPVKGALDSNDVAICIGERLLKYVTDENLKGRVARMKEVQARLAVTQDVAVRIPYFCSGCPHNSSTVVPAGSRAYAGIGCHYMAQWMDRSTLGFTQMGGEGANWIGEAPFSKRPHVFQNIGDGTYNHSGYMALRASIASGVNVTYKILYNDAVAMTGGQTSEGHFSAAQITRQVAAEGARKIVVVTDEPDKYPGDAGFAPGVEIRHRDDLDAVQRDLREISGLTVLLYDQTCAAEKRRRRKRGTYPDPARRVFINEAVCEGCGDCSEKSNCVAVKPLETELGRKRTIDQSSCNKDYSCLKGFCPSFVTVHGGELRRLESKQLPRSVAEHIADIPPPAPKPLGEPYNILIAGIGGTGVITVGALLGMAAHLDGKGCSVLDFTGLAQKNGAVLSHVRIAPKPDDLHAVRIDAGGADLLIGCDMVVAATPTSLARIENGVTRCIVNSDYQPTAAFVMNPDVDFETAALTRAIKHAAGDANADFIDAAGFATALLGDSIATNLFMLGYAVQKGLVPLGIAAIERAIELNGAAIEMNKRALAWGRLAAHDRRRVEAVVHPMLQESAKPPKGVAEIVARRAATLAQYQDEDYARRYRGLVAEVERAERARLGPRAALAEAVAENLFKLMAYKDEYEVARLYTDGAFLKQLRHQFAGNFRLGFHLAPPLFAKRDPATGQLRKREYGAWIFPLFKLLARLKFLRGTKLDVFGRTSERRMERQLIADYENVIRELIESLVPANHALAVEIAQLPERIRGYGHVKDQAVAVAKAREAALLDAFRRPAPAASAAE